MGNSIVNSISQRDFIPNTLPFNIKVFFHIILVKICYISLDHKTIGGRLYDCHCLDNNSYGYCTHTLFGEADDNVLLVPNSVYIPGQPCKLDKPRISFAGSDCEPIQALIR